MLNASHRVAACAPGRRSQVALDAASMLALEANCGRNPRARMLVTMKMMYYNEDDEEYVQYDVLTTY